MTSHWYHYECHNPDCPGNQVGDKTGVVLDVRLPSDGENPTMICPLCEKTMGYQGSSIATESGHQAQRAVSGDALLDYTALHRSFDLRLRSALSDNNIRYIGRDVGRDDQGVFIKVTAFVHDVVVTHKVHKSEGALLWSDQMITSIVEALLEPWQGSANEST